MSNLLPDTHFMFSRANLLLLTLLCTFLLSCKTQKSVSESIRNQLQSGKSRIEMKAVMTALALDEMYVFAPYAPKGEICKKLGLSAWQCSKAGLRDVDEGEFLLVFTHDGEIAHTESFSRRIGDFDESERCAAVPLAIEKARFKVERKNGFLLVCE